MKNNKLVVIIVFLFSLSFFIVTFLQIKKSNELKQKYLLSGEIKKVVGVLISDLRSHQEKLIQEIPVDDIWHQPLGYQIKDGHLSKDNGSVQSSIADNIVMLHLRRQQQNPGILEVEIIAQKDVSLDYHLRIRIRQ